LLWCGGRKRGASAIPYGVKCSGADSPPPFCWTTAQEPMRRGTNCEVMDQRRRPGASSAAGAPACPHSAAVESAEARLPTRELAGRAASSTAGGPAESPPGSEASAAAAPASTAAMAPGEEPTWDDDDEDLWRAPWDDQSMSWGAAEPPATAALAPAAERWAWSESDGWRRDTRPVVLAGRAASSAAGAPASGPAWGAASSDAGAPASRPAWDDDVGDYWFSSWIDVISDWPGPRLPLRAAPSAAENATGAKSAGKGSPKSQQKGKQQKADHYAGTSGVFPSKGGAYWPTGRGWIWRPYPR